MNSTRPVYLVTDAESNRRRLVRASNAATAVRHVTRSRYAATRASVDEALELLDAGVRVEIAGEDGGDVEQAASSATSCETSLPETQSELVANQSRPRVA